MAIVYANSAGNWTDDTIWYSEGQPYGQIPQKGDTVYPNGFVVTLNISIIDIGNGTLRNDECPYTNITGGYFSPSSASNRFIANLVGGSTHLIAKSNIDGQVVIGNVTTSELGNYGIFRDEGTSYNCAYNITGDVILNNGYIFSTHVYRNPSTCYIVGDVTINGSGRGANTGSVSTTTIIGNITKVGAASGGFSGNNTERGFIIEGNIIGGESAIISSGYVRFDGNITGGNGYVFASMSSVTISDGSILNLQYYLTNSGNIILGGTTTTNYDFTSGSPTTFDISGTINTTAKLSSNTITTINNNGTINTSAPLATNITTLNLNGTINTSNDTIADYPIGTTNIQQGSHITYTQQQPLGWGELNAPSDFEFEYNGSGVSTGAYIIVNKNLLSQSYPQESYVLAGETYGYNSEFTGTMTQPQEAVVLKNVVYDGGNKTGTLDTSNLNVPQDLTDQLDDIETRLAVLNSRLSQADIIQALETYTAVKVSDLASISIDKQDIEDALDEYHAVTEEYVAACLGEDI